MRVLPGSLTSRLLIAALLFMIMALVPCAFGQLPKRLEKCLPYPTLAQEIKAARPTEPVPTQVKVHVVRVDFSPDDGIPADAQEEISAGLQSQVFRRDRDSSYLKNLADEIAEVPVRGAFRNRGYFKVSTTASLTELWSDGADIYVALEVRATPGPQYRAGYIRVESADPERPLSMSPEVLRGFIPLQRGELFSVERVRTGLENLGRVYGREGYIDMTPEPDTEVDQARKTIDLIVRVDEQIQYQVGSIEFLGISNGIREKLEKSLPKPGEVFDRTRLNEFFTKTKALLLLDSSEHDMSVTRDARTRTVAILFDFRDCPSNSN